MRVSKLWLLCGTLCLALPVLAWADDENPGDDATAIEVADAGDAKVDDGIAEAANDDGKQDDARGEDAKEGDGQIAADDEQMPGQSEEEAEMARLDEADEQLERRTEQLVETYRQTQDENEKAQLRESLTAVVNEHLDVRQKRREREIQRLEEELKRLRQVVERRTAAREKIVSRRIDELVGEDGDDLSF